MLDRSVGWSVGQSGDSEFHSPHKRTTAFLPTDPKQAGSSRRDRKMNLTILIIPLAFAAILFFFLLLLSRYL